MKRIRLTPNQKEFNRQANRIKRFIRNAEKRGFEFQKIDLTRPKRVTKKVLKELQGLRSAQLYEKAKYVDQETGQILSGTEGRSLERTRAAQKREARKRFNKQDYTRFTDQIIRLYTQQILRFPAKVSQIVLEALDSAIARSGRDNVANALQVKADSLSDFLNRSAFFGDSIEAIKAYCQSMFGDLPGMDSEHMKQVVDATDEEEGYTYE